MVGGNKDCWRGCLEMVGEMEMFSKMEMVGEMVNGDD